MGILKSIMDAASDKTLEYEESVYFGCDAKTAEEAIKKLQKGLLPGMGTPLVEERSTGGCKYLHYHEHIKSSDLNSSNDIHEEFTIIPINEELCKVNINVEKARGGGARSTVNNMIKDLGKKIKVIPAEEAEGLVGGPVPSNTQANSVPQAAAPAPVPQAAPAPTPIPQEDYSQVPLGRLLVKFEQKLNEFESAIDSC